MSACRKTSDWFVEFSSGADRTRTDDFLLAKQALYQLSYGPQTFDDSALTPKGPPRPYQGSCLTGLIGRGTNAR